MESTAIPLVRFDCFSLIKWLLTARTLDSIHDERIFETGMRWKQGLGLKSKVLQRIFTKLVKFVTSWLQSEKNLFLAQVNVSVQVRVHIFFFILSCPTTQMTTTLRYLLKTRTVYTNISLLVLSMSIYIILELTHSSLLTRNFVALALWHPTFQRQGGSASQSIHFWIYLVYSMQAYPMRHKMMNKTTTMSK